MTKAPPALRASTEARPDVRLFQDLMNAFTVLSEACARFSQEVYRKTGVSPEKDLEGTVRRNVKIAQTVFAEGAIEILAAVYFTGSIAFADLQRALGDISATLLSARLQELEKMGLLQRDERSKAPVEAHYTLTHKGLLVSHLGEPVFLYLRLAEGWAERERASAGEASRTA